MVLVLGYLQYLCLKTQNQISDKIQQISDIFQQNISDIFQQTDISMTKSGKRHFGQIQAYFFGLIQHALQNDPNLQDNITLCHLGHTGTHIEQY